MTEEKSERQIEEEIGSLLTDRLTELMRKVTAKSLEKEIRRLEIIGGTAERKFRSVVERADGELLKVIEEEKMMNWKSLKAWCEANTCEESKVEELINIFIRSRLPTTSPIEYAKELALKLGDRYNLQSKLKIIACSVWPGDYVAKQRLLKEQDLESIYSGPKKCSSVEKI